MFLECLSYLVPVMLLTVIVGLFQDRSDAWVLVPIHLTITLGLFIWWFVGPIEATIFIGVVVGWFVLDFLPSIDHRNHRIMIAVHNLTDWVLA